MRVLTPMPKAVRWNGSVNRERMRDCANPMGKRVPLVIVPSIEGTFRY